jgi:phosphohistidine phosphatase
MRHGEAGYGGVSDADRALTEAGAGDVRRAAALLAGDGLSVGRVLHSPYVRARQTAGLVLEVIGGVALDELACLTPGGDPAAVDAALERCREDCILVVSHQPLMGKMLSWLTESGSGHPGSGRHDAGRPFATAALALVRRDFPGVAGGTLEWYRAPPDFS